MIPFTRVEGRAYPLPFSNIDTDLIIPAAYLKTIRRSGLGGHAFEPLRQMRGNVFDDPRYSGAPVAVARDNFGCGSSREHAPWALTDFGISCVIAPSFADIFYNNCFKNGLLPIALPQAEVDKLMDDAKKGGNAVLTIDLDKQTISRPDGEIVPFAIDPFRKHCMLNGLDDIGLTEQKAAEIATYETRTRGERPWVFGLTEKAGA
jgi:3-isopropylmalate/(R)-2-methylmalate dehydratase small subunit